MDNNAFYPFLNIICLTLLESWSLDLDLNKLKSICPRSSENRHEFLNENILATISDLAVCFDFFVSQDQHLFDDFFTHLFPLFEMVKDLFASTDRLHKQTRILKLMFDFYAQCFRFKAKKMNDSKCFYF